MKLSTYLGSIEWDEFCDAFRRRVPIVRPQTDSPARFQLLWADWELEAACRFTLAPHHEHFRLLIQGKKIPVTAFTDRMGEFREEAFQQLRGSGASVAFGNFENFSNPALALSRSLESEFKVPVQVNVYATPAGQQGLGVHVDPHDVLILQIQGEKEWDIYDGAVTALASAPRTVTLKQGGWLFLPKGTRHEVRNRGVAASVHFTVGFHPLTWGEVFQRALNRARVATPELNEPLPFDSTMDDAPEKMPRRLQSIFSFVNLPEFFSSYYADFPALMVQVPPTGVVERDLLERVNETTRFRWRQEALLSVKAGSRPQVNLDYRRFSLELRHDYSLTLTWMHGAAAFSASQVPMDKPAVLLLCKFLAGLGVLEIVPDA